MTPIRIRVVAIALSVSSSVSSSFESARGVKCPRYTNQNLSTEQPRASVDDGILARPSLVVDEHRCRESGLKRIHTSAASFRPEPGARGC
jgi:hypothetical protein